MELLPSDIFIVPLLTKSRFPRLGITVRKLALVSGVGKSENKIALETSLYTPLFLMSGHVEVTCARAIDYCLVAKNGSSGTVQARPAFVLKEGVA